MDETNRPAALAEIVATTRPDLEVGGVVFRSSDFPAQEAAEAGLWKLIQSIEREVHERQAARSSVGARLCRGNDLCIDFVGGYNTNWPDDADGDLLCALQESGFDFSKATRIDFTVAFQSWPPPAEAVALLSREYPSLKVYPPGENGDGYLQFEVYALASHELVVNVQAHVSELMAPFKGECDSWGIFHDPALTSTVPPAAGSWCVSWSEKLDVAFCNIKQGRAPQATSRLHGARLMMTATVRKQSSDSARGQN